MKASRTWRSVYSALRARDPLGPAIIVTCLGASLLMVGLGHRHIRAWDEGYYVGTALEAQDANEWIVPLAEGKFAREYGKPPLSHVPIALSTKVFGIHKTAFRLPSALAALTCLMLIFLLAERVSAGAGLFASLILLTSPAWAEVGRVIWLEHQIVALDLGAIWAYSTYREKGSRWAFLVAAFLLGAAILTKQLAAVFGLAAIGVVELTSDGRSFKRLVLLVSLAVTPTLVWYVLLHSRIGEEAWSVLRIYVWKGVVHGHQHQLRHPSDFVKGVARLLGWGGLALGVSGVIHALGTRSERQGTPRILVSTLLVYVLLSVAVFGLGTRSFRTWWAYPCAYVMAVFGGILVSQAIRGAARLSHERYWGVALGVVTVFGILQSYKSVDTDWFLGLAVFVAAGMAVLTHLRPRALNTRPVVLASLAVMVMVVVVSVFGSFRHNLVRQKPDGLERRVEAALAVPADRILAEPTFSRYRFVYYLRDVPLTRASRAQGCEAARNGENVLILAHGRHAPGCWKEIPGRRQRVRTHGGIYHFLAPGRPEP